MENRSELSKVSKRVDKLPTLPGIALKLLAAVGGEAPDLKEIVALISSDPPLSAKVLGIANSPYYGLGGEVMSVHRAAVLLGLNTIRNLALGFSLVSRFRSALPASDYKAFWKDALIGAVSAKWTADTLSIPHGENIFFMGLLQDIGRLVLMETAPREYLRVLEDVGQRSESCHESEMKHLGVDHTQVGAHVLRGWGLPASFTTPIRFHHSPEELDSDDPDTRTLARILHVSALTNELFKAPDSIDASRRLMHCLRTDGEASRLDPKEMIAQVGERVKNVLPIFEIDVDEQEHLAIVEKARDTLASLSNDLLTQVLGQSQKIEKLKSKAEKDGLTGLGNRRKLDETLEEEIRHADRWGTPLCLILADIDDFKKINDTLGHPAGDHALRSVAGWIAGKLREKDHAARYGGEEFALILPGTGLESALGVAERLRKAIAAACLAHDGRTFGLTMSFGVAEYDPRRENTAAGLIRMADQALYLAKKGGKNRCRACRPEAQTGVGSSLSCKPSAA